MTAGMVVLLLYSTSSGCCCELLCPLKALTGGQAHSSLPHQPPAAEFGQHFIDFEAQKSNFEAASLSRVKGTCADSNGGEPQTPWGSQLSTRSLLKQCPSSIFRCMFGTTCLCEKLFSVTED